MQLQKVVIWCLRALAPLFVAYIVVAVMKVWRNRAGVFSTDDSSPEDVKVTRIGMRSLLTNVTNAIVTSIAAVALVRAGGDPGKVATRFGLIFAAVSGFAIDLMGATDEAVENLKGGKAVQFVTRKLFSWDFVRYMVSVLLDVMITAPIMGGLMGLLNDGAPSIRAVLESGGAYDRLVAQNLETLVSTVVGAVVFNAYSQQTKAAWAYVDRNYPAEKRIPGSTIFLATAVAGAGLVSYQSRYAEPLAARMMYVMTALGLMTALTMYGHDDKQEGEYETPKGSAVPGLAVLLGFAAFGILSPLASRNRP